MSSCGIPKSGSFCLENGAFTGHGEAFREKMSTGGEFFREKRRVCGIKWPKGEASRELNGKDIRAGERLGPMLSVSFLVAVSFFRTMNLRIGRCDFAYSSRLKVRRFGIRTHGSTGYRIPKLVHTFAGKEARRHW